MARYYVYALIDPRDLQPFYIGKGTASRRFNHMKKIPNATVGQKGERIQEIQDTGLIVQSAVMGWYETEDEAYEAEKAKIAAIGLDNLTNKVAGGNGDRKPERKSTKAKEVKLTPKQEKFCQTVASGTNQSDAYRLAYDAENMKPPTVHVNANKMMNDKKIATRIKELRQPVLDDVEVTLQGLLNKLDKAYEIAETTDQASGMVAAVRELGKLADLYPAEKRVNQNYDMNELQTRIQAGRERLRVVNGGK
jgi:phage terminase small subunit